MNKKHGVLITKHKKYQTKKIWQNGYRMVTYMYQPFGLKFKNKMINDNNQHHCGGWTWQELDNSHSGELNRVLIGLKPMAAIFAWKKEELDDLIKLIDLNKFDYNEKIRYNQDGTILSYYIIVSCKGKMKDLFDLDLLQQDYLDNGIEININLVKEKELKDYFNDWDHQDKDSKIEPWETGLILGYPIENTISIYKCGVK